MNNASLLDRIDLETLRQRGLIVTDAEGTEGLRISVQCLKSLPAEASREQWRQQLECWCEEVASTLCEHGAMLYPETLSTAAQTVEAFVPVDRLEETIRCEQLNGVRLDVIVSHRVTL